MFSFKCLKVCTKIEPYTLPPPPPPRFFFFFFFFFFFIPNRFALYFSEATWVENNISLWLYFSLWCQLWRNKPQCTSKKKKSHENSTCRDSNPRQWAWRAWVWCLTHRANSSDANGRISLYNTHSCLLASDSDPFFSIDLHIDLIHAP